MPQLHFYVPEDVAARLRERAASESLSISRYVAKLVSEQVHPGWPEGYEQLFGAANDFPEIDGAENLLPSDSPRDFHLL